MMKKLLSLVLACALLALPASFVMAAGLGYGARAIGMGGAYTAVADDGTAPYWNPAGISQIKILTLTPGVGVYGKYDQKQFDEMMNSTDYPPTIPETRISLPLYLGISTRYAALNAFIDININTWDKDSYYKVYADGSGYGTLTGAATFDQLRIGANVKMVSGSTAQGHISKVTVADPQHPKEEELNVLRDGNNNYIISANGNGWSFDLGALYTIDEQWKVGAVGRNLLSSVNWAGEVHKYTIDEEKLVDSATVDFKESVQPYSATSSLPRTFAFGASYKPYKSGLLAADVEIISADEADLNQTRLHLGFEQTALWNIFALRLGAFTEKDQPVGLTAGLGLKLGPFMLDLAALKAGESEYGAFITGGLKF